jgi:hypothetical protein
MWHIFDDDDSEYIQRVGNFLLYRLFLTNEEMDGAGLGFVLVILVVLGLAAILILSGLVK